MQQRAYNLFSDHSQQVSPKTPLLLINALQQMLEERCVISAPTGKAAFNVRSVTLHSLLELPVGQKGQRELSGAPLVQLQEELKDVEYVIIDEYLMLGQMLFGWINRRLRQITVHSDELFGGRSLILTGDPAQLLPVGDKSLYHSQPTSDIGEQGYLIYHQFYTVVRLQGNHRVQGSNPEQIQFRDMPEG